MSKLHDTIYPPLGGRPDGACPPNTGVRWVFGNIRRKLTLFVVLILGMVIGLFWFFAVFLLPTAYSRTISNDQTAVLSTVAKALEETAAEGLPLTATTTLATGATARHLSTAVVEKLNAAIAAGTLNLTNRCIDISDATLLDLLVEDRLETGCALHPDYTTGIGAAQQVQLRTTDFNSELAVSTRRAVLQQGSYYAVVNNQIVRGRTAVNGQYSVVVSVTLERIPQAVSVLKSLMLPMTVLLGLLSVTAAWAFSRWFTKPLSRLSVAAKEMARGNYDVRVDDCGDDEIGDLSRDFNTMAQEVKRSAELQRDLMANVSHDLRTPLTLIKGYAETVRDLSGDDPKRRTEQLNVIVDESDRLSALVGSVMELSRMSSGAGKSEPVRFDVAQLCDEMTFRYDTVCRQNGYTFVYVGEEGCDILADPSLVERALHNLLGNALSHVGADGFIGLRVHKTDHHTARVEVSDHGPGIDEKDLPHLFDRYYRSRADAGKPGTGLGLSITKAIFESQGFEYGVESKLGEGATFWFEAKLVSERKRPGVMALAEGELKASLTERGEPEVPKREEEPDG